MAVTIFFLFCIIFFYIYAWGCYFLGSLLDKFLDFSDYIFSTNKVVYKIIRILPVIIYLIFVAFSLIFFPIDDACLLISVVTLVFISNLLIMYFVSRKKY